MKHSSLLADVSRETSERLAHFSELLLRWNCRINLVSKGDEQHLWERHIADSLQLLPFLKGGSRAIDLGSGAGFPGLILAIASGIHFDLIEVDQRKAAFLREAAALTCAPITVHVSRIENTPVAQADIITARALAPLARLIELASPLLRHHGECLFLKGANAARELTDARATWNMDVEQIPSMTHPDGLILRIRSLRHV